MRGGRGGIDLFGRPLSKGNRPGLFQVFHDPQGPPGVAGHGKFVVINVPDNALAVYDVGESGGAQPEPPPDVVEAPHLAGGIAPQVKGDAVVRGKPLQPCHVVRADAYDQGIPFGKVRLGVSKLPGLDGSTVGEGPEEEVDDNVPAPMFQKVELPSRNQGHGKGWRNESNWQHNGHRLKDRAGICQLQSPLPLYRRPLAGYNPVRKGRAGDRPGRQSDPNVHTGRVENGRRHIC